MLPIGMLRNEIPDLKRLPCVKVPANPAAASGLRHEIRVYKDLQRTRASHALRLLGLSTGMRPYLAVEAINGLTQHHFFCAVEEMPTAFVWRVLADLLQGVDFARVEDALASANVPALDYNADLVLISVVIRGLATICDSRDTLVTWLDAD